MGRILAIDYGRKRCGIAVTDTLHIVANGLPTQRTCDLLSFLKDYADRETIDAFVVGLPTTLRGLPSESQRYITPFLRTLRSEFPSIPIFNFDERFTSTIAHREMIAGGVRKSDRQRKDLADQTAAVIILTDFLNSRLYSEAFNPKMKPE